MAPAPLYKIIPACGREPWSSDEVTSCPIAEACESWVGEAVGLFAALKGGVPLDAWGAVPSAAMLEALRVLHSETAAVEAAARRRDGD